MVYRGRPSAGCSRCRTRRLKCDLKRPSCSQCVRAGCQCAGYRNPAMIRFHDESQQIMERARPGERNEDVTLTSRNLSIATVDIPINDRAAGFIITHYGRGGSGQSAGSLAFLIDLLPTDRGCLLTPAVHALGLASLANIYRSPRLVLAARAEYSVALAATNAALQDPGRCRADATVAAVMLLAMYGVVTCQSTSIINRWLSHVDGAMKLLELRGSAQLAGPVGLEMFSQLRLQILLSSLYRRRYTPEWLLNLSHEALSYRTPEDRVQDVFFGLFARVGNLCAALRDGSLRDPGEVLQTAQQIDGELVEWTRTVHPSCRFTLCDLSNGEQGPSLPPDVMQYHIYPDIGAHHLWSTYRIVRIVVHELIIKFCQQLQAYLGSLHPQHASICTHSIAISRGLVAEICASAPYVLGVGNNDKDSSAAGMYRLMWPFFIAANSVVCSPETRAWIVQGLDQIGHRVGIYQSLTLAQVLRNGQRDRQANEPDPEDIMLHEQSMRRGRRIGVEVQEGATAWGE
ncbi:hypothetical protein P170DRAFT_490813 [Aspergillus steynii IBT 23096]|uniref:Zn(2)-C6 fungal-type domain-containing protein n=1 Tax=Aspergillus steynii IBT 23096 TaxID=1392250 RepID=A0A2I2GL43_9EURO|nr:uncharacterized protein P170DRAFT_490813 [Aspergillus steynii IBT 23096]PLB53569.1 hypothetical protein P170DRAFT_490813 [Aspergillus steynii IBT 23096]